MNRFSLGGGLVAAIALQSAVAQEIEEVVVSGKYDTRTIDVTDALSVAPDIAELLREAPGANVNTNGPLTGIPQYRGMYGPRIAVTLDGQQISPAGPNWMDPPLSYAVNAQLETVEVYRGIAPVSIAQESIGGAIDARKRRLDFANADAFVMGGRVGASLQSANSGYQVDADIQAANDTQRFKVGAMLQGGDDMAFPGGGILPTEYERQRYDIGYGHRFGDHSVQLDYGYNDTGETGTPALPMDIDYIEGDLYDLTYRFDPAGNLALRASVHYSELDHGMTNFHLRRAPMPAMFRQNIAATENMGFKLEATLVDDAGQWTAGTDGLSATHDSNIDNPTNPMFFVVNFNNASRDVIGAFLERQHQWNHTWSGELGVRVNRVSMNADEVNGTPAMMMPPAQALRDRFNAADRDQSDTNVDTVARLAYAFDVAVSAYIGLAQKMRAPSHQERYLWLPLEATAGLADGQVYIGNIKLDSEQSRTMELGLDWVTGNVSLRPRLFYSRVDDYIQGTQLDMGSPATMMVRMMNMANGTSRQDPLQFNNVDAELYGFDMDWRWQLSDRWALSGLVNYVRGERRDVEDNLYRIAPPNMTARLHYELDRWGAQLESVLYASHDDVSAENREQSSAGYGVVNVSGSWRATPSLQFSAGVNNLFDREYQPHLAGYNRAANPDIAIGERLPAQGINLFARVSYAF
ncbi:TonB-dependent receptor [Halioglobus pacificus]|uniref:Ligand-gated channel n=1 Tax=Parahalioglobus pacificus TaxID=930806 RepID=A0A918XL74_9GAMM|nr:TonB-dependent receptor [Halioglobus pacificus]GHD37093.1 ligand-gated channel [Halioglobus pacificus]